MSNPPIKLDELPKLRDHLQHQKGKDDSPFNSFEKLPAMVEGLGRAYVRSEPLARDPSLNLRKTNIEIREEDEDEFRSDESDLSEEDKKLQEVVANRQLYLKKKKEEKRNT